MSKAIFPFPIIFSKSLGLLGKELKILSIEGEELVYLDPHTTQAAVDLDETPMQDESFHCRYSSRMKILDLDPSIALVSLSWDVFESYGVMLLLAKASLASSYSYENFDIL